VDDVRVLTTNQRGKHRAEGVPTLFFLPHCPRKLYDNVLWANWSELDSITIVGNSLVRDVPLQQRSDAASDCPYIESLRPWLREIRLDGADASSTRGDAELCAGNFVGAFNDTYLTTVVVNDETDPTTLVNDDSKGRTGSTWPQVRPSLSEDDDDVDPELL